MDRSPSYASSNGRSAAKYDDRHNWTSTGGSPSSSRMNKLKYKTNTLPIDNRERCVSMPPPSGHYAATPNSMTTPRNTRGKSPGTASANGDSSYKQAGFTHYGSSLSLSNGSSAATGDLISRTLRPPSPTTLKKSSLPGKVKFGAAKPNRPSLPSLNTVQLESPKLADYLEKPRLVRSVPTAGQDGGSRVAASEHHAKRLNAADTSYRNLRLGNFIDTGESNEEELIPERLRAYYLDTYLNVCHTCESKTHLDPTSPIQRGM